MQQKKTVKPEKVRTHCRYTMRKQVYKQYVKCSCGTPLVLTSAASTTCNCGYTFTGGYGMSQPGGQRAPWPTSLHILTRNKKHRITAGYDLCQIEFNLGRNTRKLIDEIKDLGATVYEHNDRKCADGRVRISSLSMSYMSLKPYMSMECGFYFGEHYNHNNKTINDRLRLFRDDLIDFKKVQSDGGLSWKAPRASSEEKVVTQVMMKYEY